MFVKRLKDDLLPGKQAEEEKGCEMKKRRKSYLDDFDLLALK